MARIEAGSDVIDFSQFSGLLKGINADVQQAKRPFKLK